MFNLFVSYVVGYCTLSFEDDSEVIKHSDFLIKPHFQGRQCSYCLIAPAQLFQSNGVVCSSFFVCDRLGELLSGISLARFHGKLVTVRGLLHVLHLVMNHANVVVTLRCLGTEQLTFFFRLITTLSDASLECLQRQLHVLVELQVEQA